MNQLFEEDTGETVGLNIDTDDRGRKIRERIQKSRLREDVEEHEPDPPPCIDDDRRKRVAAYTRVSTTDTKQISSIEYQKKWYEETIAKKPNWEMCGIYSDEGKSGTSMKRRHEFRRMIKDASEGKIDLIVCASVSRFARNISDCVEQVEFLKNNDPTHPVGVFFESENIYTLNPDSTQTFQMHSMVADWESAIKSRRMILSYDQRIRLGHYPLSKMLGYRVIDGEYVIVHEEALTVQFIFTARAVGWTLERIAETLTDCLRTTLTGLTKWDNGMVGEIMRNERRWGDLIARKTVVTDYKKGKSAKNLYYKDGEAHYLRTGAMVKNHHEGIVSPELAKAAKSVINSTVDGGVADLYVIQAGRLKGFVSISLGWNGIDDDVLMNACMSVYTKNESAKFPEYVQEQESNDFARAMIPVHANIPCIVIGSKAMVFNKKIMDFFEKGSKVKLYYHPVIGVLMIVKTDENEQGGFVLNDGRGEGRRILSPGITRAIMEHMKNKKEAKIRLRGIPRVRGNKRALFFAIGEYSDTEQENIFAKYKGIYNLLINQISESDFKEPGVNAVNTKIGPLPERAEIDRRVNELLERMQRSKDVN